MPRADADPDTSSETGLLARAAARFRGCVPPRILGLEPDRFALAMLWAWSVAFALAAVLGIAIVGYGSDSHAYYIAWQGPMYDELPGSADAYLYSPAFAQLFWPLTLLPWPLVAAAMSAAAAATLMWLLAPVRMRYRLPLLLMCLPEVITGNIFWLLALVAVFGSRFPGLWTLPVLTKVLPALGPMWFLARGEWRRLAVAVATCVVVVAVSVATAPDLWREWLRFLLSSSQEDGVSGSPLAPPLWVRLPAAVALTVYAARRDRPALLPMAMLLATPVIGHGSFALLAAVPRLAAPTTTGPASVHGRR